MAIPLLAAAAAKAAAAKVAAAKVAAATAAKGAAAKAVATKGSTAASVAKGVNSGADVAQIAKPTSGKLSIGMLADKGVNKYPGQKIDEFQKSKKGQALNEAAKGGVSVNVSKPTVAPIKAASPNPPQKVYDEQIQKLKSLQ